jgi:hypothetical protein
MLSAALSREESAANRAMNVPKPINFIPRPGTIEKPANVALPFDPQQVIQGAQKVGNFMANPLQNVKNLFSQYFKRNDNE